MGNFIDPQEVKDKATVDLLRRLDLEALEDLYIYPAEALIAETLNLQLDTDLDPYGKGARFDQFPELRVAFRTAYRRAVLLTIMHMAANPHGLKSQSVGGASAAYDTSAIPHTAMVLMAEWTRAGTVFRA